MIESVQSFKQSTLKANQKNFNEHDKMNKVGNSNSVTDYFIKSNHIAFKGNFTKVGRNILSETETKVGGKFRRFLGEACDSVESGIRKLTGKDDLPVAKKPITADMSNTAYDKEKALAEEAAKRLKVKQQAEEATRQLENARVTPDGHDYNTDGTLSKYGQAKIDKWGKHHHDPDLDGSTKPIAGFRGASDTTANITEQTSNKAGMENSIEIKADAARSIGSAGQHTGNISEQAKTFFASSGNKTDILHNVPDIADHHIMFSEFMDKFSYIADKLEKVPHLVTVAEAAIVLKFIKPIEHVFKGEFGKAAVTTGTRVVDTALYPIKILHATGGGLKGLILKARGIKGDGAGFYG